MRRKILKNLENRQKQYPIYWIAILQYNNESNFRSKICDSFDEAKQWIEKETEATNLEVERFMTTYLINHDDQKIQINYTISGYKRAVIVKTTSEGLFLWELKR